VTNTTSSSPEILISISPNMGFKFKPVWHDNEHWEFLTAIAAFKDLAFLEI